MIRPSRRFAAFALSLFSAGNLAAVWFAAADPMSSAEPWHATIHAVLALGSGLLAQRLVGRRSGVPTDSQARIEGVEADVDNLRQELLDAQERLDFAERMLAQRPSERLPRE
jgi:hypothetical protein